MVAILDRNYGYGQWSNSVKVRHMKKMNDSERKAFVKKLWLEDPIKYKEWKDEFCIRLNRLPEFFGTHDNPKEMDESKL
jgi:hypothetical protein